jgi:hypothetical protein
VGVGRLKAERERCREWRPGRMVVDIYDGPLEFTDLPVAEEWTGE